MKNMLKVLLAPVVALAFAGSVWAQGTTPAPAKPAAPAKTEKREAASKEKRGRGEIVTLDAKAGTVKVKSRDNEMSLVADTKETKDALAKVKVGDPVGFSYTDKDGKLVLRSLKAATKREGRSSRQKTEKTESTKPAK